MNIIYNTFPFAFHHKGGGEIQLLKYKQYLSQYNISCILFDQWNPKFEEHEIIHFFSCVSGSEFFCNYVKSLGKKLVISPSLWIDEKNKDSYDIDNIKNILSLADIIVVNSIMEMQSLSNNLSIDIKKFRCVYNGSDIFYKKVSNELFRKKYNIEGPYFLNVANIEHRKNQLAIAKVMKSFPKYKLIIIGNIRDNLYYRQIKELCEDQFIHIPYINDMELLRSAYSDCSLFLMPSIVETPSIAALEAYACYSKILITDQGSTKEYFENQVNYCNPSSRLDDLITKALNTKVKYTLDFNWSIQVKDLLPIYHELLEL